MIESRCPWGRKPVCGMWTVRLSCIPTFDGQLLSLQTELRKYHSTAGDPSLAMSGKAKRLVRHRIAGRGKDNEIEDDSPTEGCALLMKNVENALCARQS